MKLNRKNIVFSIMSVLLVTIMLFSACSSPAKEDTQPQRTVHTPGEKFTIGSAGDYSEKYTYEELKSALDDELSKKSFCDEANAMFESTFEALYKNYNEWRESYPDIPERSEFIKTMLIDSVSLVRGVDYYVFDTDEGFEKYELEGVYAYTDPRRNIYFNWKDGDEYENEEAFFHEVIHCGQRFLYDNDFIRNIDDYEYMLVEGGASFYMEFCHPVRTQITDQELLTDEAECYEVEYGNTDGNGYLFHVSLFHKLIYLLGYDAMDKVRTGEEDVDYPERLMREKYGEENSDEFFGLMKKLIKLYEKTSNGDKIYNTAVDFEKSFEKLWAQNIKMLDKTDKAAVLEYAGKYRAYKINMPRIAYYRPGKYENITRKVIDLPGLDDLMAEAVIASDAFGVICEDEGLNKEAIKLFFEVDDDNYQIFPIFGFISRTEYMYCEEDGEHFLYMYYFSMDNDRTAVFEFDENGIIDAKTEIRYY